MIKKHKKTALRVGISRDISRDSRQSHHSYEDAGVSHGARRKGRMASPSPLVGSANLAGLGQLYRGVGLSRPARFEANTVSSGGVREGKMASARLLASRPCARARDALSAAPEFRQSLKDPAAQYAREKQVPA